MLQPERRSQSADDRCSCSLPLQNALTRDVLGQLQTISSQQSRIREARDQLTLFGSALERQAASVEALLAGRRLAAAYKACLAECVRRGAFGERYALSAAQLAERMGRFREKEVATRESFRVLVERHLPGAVLERLGLLQAPAHCQVSVPGGEEATLARVSVEDARRLLLPWGSATGSGSSLLGDIAAAATPRQEGPGASTTQQQEEAAAAAADAEAGEHEGGGGGGNFEDAMASLRMENARLRADLASQIALDCLRMEVEPAVPAASSAAASASSSEASGAAAAQPSPGAAAAQKFERALSTKEQLIQELEGAVSAAQAQAASYARRITALEAQLQQATAEARAAAGRDAAGAAAAAQALPLPKPSQAEEEGGAQEWPEPAASASQEAGGSASGLAGSLAALGLSSEPSAAPADEPAPSTEQQPLEAAGSPTAAEAEAARAAEELAGSLGGGGSSSSVVSSVEGIEPVTDTDDAEEDTT